MRRICGCPENFVESLSTPTATFAEISNGLLFRSIRWMYVQNLKLVALPVPEIIGGTQNISAVPGYAHAPFSPNFKGLLFAWTLWIHLPNLKFVALPVPEIIGGTHLGSPWIRPHTPFSPKFLMGFCSDGPCEYTWHAKFKVLSFTRSWDKRGTQKIGPSMDTPTVPFLQNPKFFTSLCSDGPSECIGQICSP